MQSCAHIYTVCPSIPTRETGMNPDRPSMTLQVIHLSSSKFQFYRVLVLVLVLFPDHELLPAEGPAGAEAAPGARGRRSPEAPSCGTGGSAGSARGTRLEISAAGEGSELQRGPAGSGSSTRDSGRGAGSGGGGPSSSGHPRGVKAALRRPGWRGTERR